MSILSEFLTMLGVQDDFAYSSKGIRFFRVFSYYYPAISCFLCTFFML
uniref:Uncharacterized protein n=1 Tax=Candidatus Kentrum sp. FM TaxID=2126340 RepID=A0A450TGW7_9GAMM|nr:MAG: hypothetical protein BECKFM1743C_GA0114222_104253 [Candidatus Kentron sp. FM]VFK16355.1 MAG: hypothetical protein BECKFM1743B_GA0114221_104153 [Candidatus Kentron sp. FM]